MKFILTESKFEQIIFKYLDNQDFIKFDKGTNTYFVNSVNDKLAQIRYERFDGYCGVNVELVREISSFFSLDKEDSENIIVKWVENTLQVKVEYSIRVTALFIV